jgi:prevent-host-death family protein
MRASIMDPNLKGNIAEAVIAAEATKLGVGVLRPTTEHGRYDMVFEVAGQLLRVQCKWARRRGDVIVVKLTSSRLTWKEQVVTRYEPGEIDFVAAYCPDTELCYLVPGQLACGRTAIQLRVEQTKNGQRASLHWATEYEFRGAVAQLAERVSGTHEVRGSNPLSSTSAARGSIDVGAHEFRNRFGWYMERAAAGEEIRVNRWGSPYVRLLPVEASP